LGAMRSALSIYYGDTEGFYPLDTLASLCSGNKYLNTIPKAKLPSTSPFNSGHSDSSVVLATTAANDGAGWAYDATQTDPNWGRLLANCSHSDSRGSAWTAY